MRLKGLQMQDDRGEFYLKFLKGVDSLCRCASLRWSKFCVKGSSKRDMKTVCE